MPLARPDKDQPQTLTVEPGLIDALGADLVESEVPPGGPFGANNPLFSDEEIAELGLDGPEDEDEDEADDYEDEDEDEDDY